jgi:hypothetical protein
MNFGAITTFGHCKPDIVIPVTIGLRCLGSCLIHRAEIVTASPFALKETKTGLSSGDESLAGTMHFNQPSITSLSPMVRQREYVSSRLKTRSRLPQYSSRRFHSDPEVFFPENSTGTPSIGTPTLKPASFDWMKEVNEAEQNHSFVCSASERPA